MASRNVFARDIFSAMSKARNLLLREAWKENRLSDLRYYRHAPVTEAELIAQSDDTIVNRKPEEKEGSSLVMLGRRDLDRRTLLQTGQVFTKATLVPIDVTLKIEDDFVKFVKKKLIGATIQKAERLNLSIFWSKFQLGVLECSPESFICDNSTELTMLPKQESYHSIFNPLYFPILKEQSK